MKVLQLVGQQVAVSAPENDFYLQTMPPTGPFDLEQLFEMFCKKESNVIDVGANIGITATIAGLLVAEGVVVALEPVAEAFQHLEANIARSELTNVRCRNLAAASVAGRVNMISNPGHNFASFVGYEGVLDRYSGYSENAVRAVTLDRLIVDEGLSHVDFIKIDVEGYELEVLRGSRTILESFRPTVFLEANHYCLNIFRRISLVDFTEEVLSIFPVVYAVGGSFEILDLTDPSTHSNFFHANVVTGEFPNLLCGFSPDIQESVERLKLIGQCSSEITERPAATSPPNDVLPSSASLPTATRRVVSGVRRRLSRS